jgi:hypothetical protein
MQPQPKSARPRFYGKNAVLAAMGLCSNGMVVLPEFNHGFHPDNQTINDTWNIINLQKASK